MKKLLMLCLFITACSATAQSRRAMIEEAEDKFCSLRAQEKQLIGEAGTTDK